MHKKGAVEMSMQTIIVVVIGVTLLTLGLRFVYTTFSGIGEQQKGISDMTDKQLKELFGQSEDPLSLPKDNIEMSQGEKQVLDLYVKNPGSGTSLFKVTIPALNAEDMPTGASDPTKWLVWTKSGRTLTSGKGFVDKLQINVPKNAITGSYRFGLNLECGDTEICPFSTILSLEVK